MHPILKKNQYFIKEHLGILKAANNYDIYDVDTEEKILECREPNLGFFTKLLRFSDYKRMTPFEVEIRTSTGELVCTVKRGISIFLSKVEVFDEKGILVGIFKQKFFTIGGKFDVLNTAEESLCTLQGKWTSWDFKFVKEGHEFAHVSKKWAGIDKELFTSADNYILTIKETVPTESDLRTLIIAAVMCIDMVLKE